MARLVLDRAGEWRGVREMGSVGQEAPYFDLCTHSESGPPHQLEHKALAHQHRRVRLLISGVTNRLRAGAAMPELFKDRGGRAGKHARGAAEELTARDQLEDGSAKLRLCAGVVDDPARVGEDRGPGQPSGGSGLILALGRGERKKIGVLAAVWVTRREQADGCPARQRDRVHEG